MSKGMANQQYWGEAAQQHQRHAQLEYTKVAVAKDSSAPGESMRPR